MFVYRIVNKENGKCYVGITDNPKKRYRQHIRESRAERSKGRKLYVAIKEFGVEKFYLEILEQTNDSSREEYWITQFNSVENGYNHTNDGKGNSFERNNTYGKTHKFQIGNTYGRNQVKITTNNISEEKKEEVKELYKSGYGVRHIRKITNVSDRMVFRIVDGIERKRRVRKPSRVILKIDMQGNVVGEYIGLKEAQDNCEHGKNGIRKVLYGDRKTAGGYYWRFKD